MKRYKHNSTSNTLEQIPEMEKPKYRPTDFEPETGLRMFWAEKWAEYTTHITFLETHNCSPGTSWPDVVNEGEFVLRSIQQTNSYGKWEVKLAYPVIPPIIKENEVVKVLDWLLYVNENGINGNRFSKIIMMDGEFYWETDANGDQPLDGKAIYTLFQSNNQTIK